MNTEFDPFDEPRAPMRGKRNTTTGRPETRFSTKTAFLAVMIAVGILIGAVWSLYPEGKTDQYSENIPIVRAVSKPLKVVPEDAGGMDIPHRDSTVFSALRPDEEERPRIENLLADNDDEEPLPRSQLFAGLSTENEEEPEKEEMVLADNEVAIVQEIGQEPTIVRPEKIIPFDTKLEDKQVEQIIENTEDSTVILPVEPMKKPAPADRVTQKPVVKERRLAEVVDNVLEEEAKPNEVAPKVEKIEKVETPPVKKQEPKVKPQASVPSGSFYVQLGSVKTRLAAESEWSRLRTKYGLSSAYRIQQKDLGARGIFYRIQSGPYSKSAATSTCNKIKASSPGACLVTR